MSHEHINLVEIHSQELDFDRQLDAEEVEGWIREEYPGIQVRTCGLGCKEFPHPKRIPFVSLGLDGCGTPIFVTIYYLKHHDTINLHESTSKVEVYATDLDFNSNLSVKELETRIRKKYKGIQVRRTGVGSKEFPHKKRIPFVSIWVNHEGDPAIASIHYLK